MLMPKKRFQFNHSYLYGSAAFVFSFGLVLTALVHFAPVEVPSANIATTAPAPETEQRDQPEATAAATTQPTAGQATAGMVNVPSSAPTTTPSAPVSQAPRQPSASTPTPDPVPEVPVTTEPVVPSVPTPDPMPVPEEGESSGLLQGVKELLGF